MPLNTQYAREIHEQYGYLATWLPTAPLKLGDVGTLKNGVFERSGNLSDVGIAFTIETHQDADHLEYSSAGAVSQQIKAQGSAPVTAGPGGAVETTVGISFTRANAVLLQATKCTTSMISNIAQVSDAVLLRFAEGDWQPANKVVVTDLISADTLTVLISSGANAELDISVKGDVGSGVAKLASANASYTVNKASSIGTSIIGQKGATPLFKARGVQRSFLDLGSPGFVERKLTDNLQLTPISINDLVLDRPIRGG